MAKRPVEPTPEQLEHIELIEALLNLASLAAELQVTDEGHDAVLAMCDRVADYYGIERIDPEDEDAITIHQGAIEEDTTTASLNYPSGGQPRIHFHRKPPQE